MSSSFSKISTSHLLALRDVGRDELRRLEKNKAELEGMLTNIKLEIESRGNRTSK